MLEYFKNHSGQIVLATALLLAGLILGLICKENGKGIYISANYPGGGPIFVIGNSKARVSAIDLDSLNESDSNILAGKIKNLAVNKDLSLRLRDMAKGSEGPFAAIPVVVNLHFTDDNKITGNVVKACKNTPVFGNVLVAYEAILNKDSVVASDGMRSLHAAWEKLSTNCDSQKDSYDVWVSKKYVEEWLGPVDAHNQDLSVKAQIVVSSLL